MGLSQAADLRYPCRVAHEVEAAPTGPEDMDRPNFLRPCPLDLMGCRAIFVGEFSNDVEFEPVGSFDRHDH